MAAFIAWKLTVNIAISKAITPAEAKTHQPIFIRYAKSCNHLLLAHQAIGEAIRIAMPTSFIKSFDNNLTTPVTEAPSTLRIPISLVRCLADVNT